MNTVDYLPGFLKDVEEFNQLCLIYDLFGGGAQANIDELVADETPNTATLKGLRRWAAIQGLTDYDEDDWETLRGKVITKFSERVPFTIIKFRQSIASLLGEGNFNIDLSTPFVVDVNITAVLSQYEKSVANVCEAMLPMNVHYEISPYQYNQGAAYIGGSFCYGESITFASEGVTNGL